MKGQQFEQIEPQERELHSSIRNLDQSGETLVDPNTRSPCAGRCIVLV